MTETVSLANQPEEGLQSWVLWMIHQLQWEVAHEGSIWRLRPPSDPADDDREIRFTFDPQQASAAEHDGAELVTSQSPLFHMLIEALRSAGPVVHARPHSQPQSVHALVPALFAAYQVDGGSMHLGGCRMEDRPFIQLLYRRAGGELDHILLDDKGGRVGQAFAEQLGMDDTVPYGPRPPRLNKAQLQTLLKTADASLADQGGAARREVLLRVLIWCKYAEGKLLVSIGEQTESVGFAGWARTLEAPPWICPHTGVATYHVAATDDGRIAAADQIEACAQSGQRVLRSELACCAATGALALPQYMAVCPVTGAQVLRSTLVECACCRQQVSPSAVERGACRACRKLAIVPKDDPRMARLLGEFPRLDRWKKWELSETGRVYIAVASGLLKRLLVVVDKDTLQLCHLAWGNRFSQAWSPVPPVDQEALVR